MKKYNNSKGIPIVPTLSCSITDIALFALLTVPLFACSSEPIKKTPKQDDTYTFSNSPIPNYKAKQLKQTNDEAIKFISDLSQAKQSIETGQVDEAADLLNLDQRDLAILPRSKQREYWEVRSEIAYQQFDIAAFLKAEQQLHPFLTSNNRTERFHLIFERLLVLDRFSLQRLAYTFATNRYASDWISLVLTVTGLPTTAPQQKAEIFRWQNKHKDNPVARNLPEPVKAFISTPTPTINKVGLLLPLTGPLAAFGKAIEQGFLASSQRLGLQVNVYDVHDSASLNQAIDDMVQSDIHEVVGPLDKKLISSIWQSNRFRQILSLNYVPDLAPRLGYAQFGLGIEDEARMLAKICLYSNKNNVLVITEQGPNGTRGFREFSQYMPPSKYQQLLFDNTKSLASGISDAVNVSSTDLKQYRSELKQYEDDPESFEISPTETILEKNTIDAVVVFATPVNAAQVTPLLDFYYAFDTPVLATSGSYELGQADDLGKAYEGDYITDIPVLGRDMDRWHLLVNIQPEDFDPMLSRFYALGIDAAIALVNQEKLALFPGFAVRGTTGTISYHTDSQTIARSPLLYIVQGGKLVPAPTHTIECSEGKRLCL